MAGLLSVIVPVYNTAPYLKKCIDSILGQTYKDIELLLVDDGSTDGSLEICNDFAEKDKRVKLFHNPHLGAMAARQTGGRAAKGDLITFADSDDWLDPNMYEQMIALMDEMDADVVCTGHYEEFSDKSQAVYSTIPSGFYSGKEKLEKDIYSRMLYIPETGWFGISANCWNKLFKRYTIYDALMQTDERLRDGDDHAFVYPALLRADSVYLSDLLPYHHRRHLRNSLSTEYGDDVFERFGYLYSDMKHRLEESGYWDVVREGFSKQMRWFLLKYLREALHTDIYEDGISERPFIFPFARIERGANIILYGAGNVGKTYYSQIRKTRYCTIAGWADSNCKIEGIIGPEEITKIKFDYIVIAVSSKDTKEEIEKNLCSQGIDRDIIVWEDPNIYE